MFGVTDTGFVMESREDIVSRLNSRFKSTYGSSFDTSPESPDGQLIGIVADAVHEAMLREERSYNNFIPSKAFGVGLDGLVELNGITRLEDLPTYVSLLCTGTSGTRIPKGSIAETSKGIQFATDTEVIIAAGETTATVRATCTISGEIIVNRGTITKIVTPVGGWTAVNNPEDAVTGTVRESDTQLRARRERNTINRGTSSADAIYEAVADLNLNFIAIRENDSDTALANGQPPHSIHVVADGGTPDELAKRIYDNKADGIQAWGSIVEVVKDSKGYDHDIGLDRPAEISIDVEVDIERLDGSSNDSLDNAETVILGYINGLNIGEDVHWSILFAPIAFIPDVVVRRLVLRVTGSGNPFTQDSIMISDIQKAVATAASIVITEV